MSAKPVSRKRRRIVWILLAFLLLFFVGSVTGIFIFKNVLRPGQQQRVIDVLPFMENFLWRPPEDYALPTPLPSTSEISPEDLLNITIEIPTPQATDEVTRETRETTIPEGTAIPTLMPEG